MGQRIPVVFHIVSKNPTAITDVQIINALNNLNEAFSHSGAYGAGPGANTGLSFCLAQIGPDGGITTGITRTESVLSDADADIENFRLKALSNWDPTQYCNIWVIDSLREEIYPNFNCGQWSRMKEGGYASASNGTAIGDGIVTTGFGQLLAHEMGHYLSLQHTFVLGNCSNNNCDSDGDGVCDTPPSSVASGPCTSPQNSCLTDTLSGFTVDMKDMNENFMSYADCRSMFTEGQAKKMRDFLLASRSSLLAQDKCSKPCTENISASFTRDDWFPVSGTTVNFTSSVSGGSGYRWTVNGVLAGSSPNLSYTFPSNGKYRVSLNVSNADPACYASYSDEVIVTCGVMARFYPDKRIIASKTGTMLDSIFFTNRSVNAASYQWLMANDDGMGEQVVSSAFDLNYVFAAPANYTVRLVATNGACSDTTEKFRFNVADPIVDGTVSIRAAECFQQTKITLSIQICNNGYGPIPSGTPISFYDADPRQGNANRIDTVFLMPDTLAGRCCSGIYTFVLDVKRVGLNTVFAVFNDRGTSTPWQLPNTSLIESDYNNNVTAISGFQFKVSIIPPSAILKPGDTLALQSQGAQGVISSYAWSNGQYLSCTDCSAPLFVAERNGDAVKRLIAVSENGCIDSAFTSIKVPVADDFTVRLDTIGCAPGDSLRANFTICNLFAKGGIRKGLKLSLYNADPALPSAQLLAPVFVVDADNAAPCVSYTHTFKDIGSREIFAVVNDNGTLPHQLPNDTLIAEVDYKNNMSSLAYILEQVEIVPADTTVYVNQVVPFRIASVIADPSSVTWTPASAFDLSCTNCIAPSAVVTDSGIIKVEMKTFFGCTIRGEARVNIFPPDLTVDITETKCYTNKKTLVRFTVCMNNGYDSVFKNIPVSFYDGDPSTGNAVLLDNSFRTPGGRGGSCDTFTVYVNTPLKGVVFAAVNDRGTGSYPDNVFAETALSNNLSDTAIDLFTVSANPADTTILRNGQMQLYATVSGGNVGSLTWSPGTNLTCISCPDPVARPPYSQQYIVTAKNEFSCIVTDTAMVRTYADGKVNLPNAFTPNGDGKNDVFYVLGSRDIFLVNDFSVYNRYGQKVFGVLDSPPNNPLFGWNGMVNGKRGAAGTYVYAITITFSDKTSQLYKGTITLIH